MKWNGSFSDSEVVTTQFLLAQAAKYLQPGVINLGHANHPTVLGCFDQLVALIHSRRPHARHPGRDVRHEPGHRLNARRTRPAQNGEQAMLAARAKMLAPPRPRRSTSPRLRRRHGCALFGRAMAGSRERGNGQALGRMMRGRWDWLWRTWRD